MAIHRARQRSCSEAEPVAQTLADYCAEVSDDPVCQLELEQFVAAVIPECVAEAGAALFADRCVLPLTMGELRSSPWLVERSRVALAEVSGVAAGSVLEQQLVAAVGATGQVVATAAEALARTDDEAFEVVSLLDLSTRRGLVVITATYGDNRYGRVFFEGTDFVVADVIDGDISACLVERRVEGTPCTADATCGESGHCAGVVFEEVCVDGVCETTDTVIGEGRCAGTFPSEAQPSAGQVCAVDEGCPTAEGLVCAIPGDLEDGTCADAWQRRRFAVEDAPIAGGTTTAIPLVVSGVATTSIHTSVSMILAHPNPSELTVSIQHPGGGSRAVIFEDPAAVGPEVVLRGVTAALPSDESILGTWTILVEDRGAGAADAALWNAEVLVESAWD